MKLPIFLTMKEITTDTNTVLDFDALTHSSNARLSSPVTIYRGVHPKPVKTILLKDLLRDRNRVQKFKQICTSLHFFSVSCYKSTSLIKMTEK